MSFTYIFYYIGYSSYKHSIEEFKLTVINRSPYIPDASPKFPPCGTINFLSFGFQATWQHPARRINITWNVARRSRGIEVHGISNQHVVKRIFK